MSSFAMNGIDSTPVGPIRLFNNELEDEDSPSKFPAFELEDNKLRTQSPIGHLDDVFNFDKDQSL